MFLKQLVDAMHTRKLDSHKRRAVHTFPLSTFLSCSNEVLSKIHLIKHKVADAPFIGSVGDAKV